MRLFVFFILSFSPVLLPAKNLERTVYALFNEKLDEDVWFSSVHQYSSMPLEHLGLRVQYVDVNKPLPSLSSDDGVRGVILWNLGNFSEQKQEEILNFLSQAVEVEKKVVLMDLSLLLNINETSSLYPKVEQIFSYLGLVNKKKWTSGTYFTKLNFCDREMMGFEREVSGIFPSYPMLGVSDEKAKKYLIVEYPLDEKRGNLTSCLAMTCATGGYVSNEYAVHNHFFGDKEFRKWYINPFLFFQRAFDTNSLPKPDVSLRLGRRIYYSHIDGDGCNNVSRISLGEEKNLLSSKIIEKKILEPFPHLPCTVAPIMGDLDPKWIGSSVSQEIAKAIFQLPHIEPASHTYSHPFEWAFFANYKAEKELPFLSKYPFGSWIENKSIWEWLGGLWSRKSPPRTQYRYPQIDLDNGYTIPRAFANFPFNLHQEIVDSMAGVNKLCPKGKKAHLLQWSGDCQPFTKAIELVYQNGFNNLNGGDTRFDGEFSSFSWVRPLYRVKGGYLQPYASMSNENTYTDLWTKKFYAFNQLQVTWKHTGFPLLLRPINLYYHMYSGEKQASMEALLQNIAYVEASSIHPMTTNTYAQSVQGFFKGDVEEVDGGYTFSQTKVLSTLRFDNAVDRAVDFSSSRGVIGQKHLHGSLYTFLDPEENNPLVVLKDTPLLIQEPVEQTIYIVESRWDIHAAAFEEGSFTFKGKGFGPLEMVFCVPVEGKYTIAAFSKEGSFEKSFYAKDHALVVEWDLPSLRQYTFVMQKDPGVSLNL